MRCLDRILQCEKLFVVIHEPGIRWSLSAVIFRLGRKKLLLQGKNEAGRALYWPVCQNLEVPYQK